MIYQVIVNQLCFNFSLVLKQTGKEIAPSNWHQKRRGRDARMHSCLIYFFAPFFIPHNHVIPQAMPHAIPQTYSSFYPHRLQLMARMDMY